MKLSILTQTIVGILISSSTYADYTDIPQAQLDSYKKAFSIAAKNSLLLNCSASGILWNRYLDTYVLQASSGKLKKNGDQPILIFEREVYPNNFKYIATVVSSSDFRSLVSVQVVEFNFDYMNVGDLLNPELKKDYILKTSAECH